MAAVDILAAFGYNWADTGTVAALDDAQYKAGWAFIGATPPSVEQFNKVHQIADQKSNWLYAQLAAVFTAAGEVPSVGDLTSLRDSLRAVGLFQTAPPGNNTTLAATTAFVTAADAALIGRVLNVRRFTAGGTYTPTAGTRAVIVELVGGGGGGGGAPAVGASQTSQGAPGAAGAYSLGYFTSAFSGVTVTVGAAGVAASGVAGGSGGASSFGALLTAPGGNGGGVNAATASAIGIAGNVGTAAGTGGLVNSGGNAGTLSLNLNATAFFSTGGQGGSGRFGAGSGPTAGNVSGGNATGYGAGGAGTANANSSGALTGGQGTAGIVIITELS